MPSSNPQSMTVDEQINYYCNLLCIQYKTLPNATGTIQALVTETVAGQISQQVLNGFDLETAVGAQLDILARYVGAPRTIFGYDPTIPYFALTAYADAPATSSGFASYSDTTDPVDFWISYVTGETAYDLTDGQMRALISYVVAVHASDHTVYAIDLILDAFFGDNCTMTDNGDMTITYTHQTSDPDLLFGIINSLNLLPHPAGTEIEVVEV